PTIKDISISGDDERFIHQTIKKVTLDLEGMNFNTAISQMMIFVNEFLNRDVKPKCMMETFVLLLSPFAPHIAEELWQKLGHTSSLAYEKWPRYDDSKTEVKTIELVVQVNGKLRAKIQVGKDLDEEQLKIIALQDENVVRNIEGKEIIKIVVVKNKLVSIVVK
ncbi:MAG: class I tRNA ligase family protein, partial [Ignavibacteriales bacterium]|nr:class I tRNA ligase family protein [Ignavibacteriales bacterium]